MAKAAMVLTFTLPFFLLFLVVFPLVVFILDVPHFLPPEILSAGDIPLVDELDDHILFHRAVLSENSFSYSSSSSSQKGCRYPVKQPATPKIAFLFLVNSDISFAPLWDLFFQSGNQSGNHSSLFNVYVHADPNVPIARPKGGVFRDRFISSKPTHRASPTLISAARRLLATALLDDSSNSYFALLSQHCVPLHSFDFVYNSLFKNHRRRRSFIEIIDDEPCLWDRYIARGGNVMMPEIPFDQFRVGSQFFVLTRCHALMVVSDRLLWKKFKLPCLKTSEYSCYPEEHYFPTLLSMLDPDGCSGHTLTSVNWTGLYDGHPRTYYPDEVSPELVAELRKPLLSSGYSNYSYLFARKFDAGCLRPLMGMADSVIFKD